MRSVLEWAATRIDLVTHPPAPLRPAEFKNIALATGTGMIVMGFVGFFVKLIHIPINQIIVGGG